MIAYLLDSNFFIEAHRTTYPFDVAPRFWIKIKELAHSNIIFSVDKVKNELYNNNDELENWCKTNLPPNFFKDTSQKIEEYLKVTAWAASMSHHYKQKAISDFLQADEADAFIIAYALSNKDEITIVTHEVSDPRRKNRIKIPEPCDFFKIKYLNTIGMFRSLRETF